MLIVFHGNDASTVRDAVRDWIGVQTAVNTSVVHLDADNYSPGVIAEQVGGSSLFGDTITCVLETPSVNTDMWNEMVSNLPQLATSPHQFVLRETTLLAAQKKLLQPHASELNEYKTTAPKRANAFAMTDALLSKNKKKLWLELQAARKEQLSAEEIIGTVWWQLKSLRLAQISATAADAGMKEFTYNKAKRAAGNFSEEELRHISHSLLRVYHEGHGGIVDIDIALEEWVLSI